MKKNKIEPPLQAFKINLSKGDPMQFDVDELHNVVLAIKTGTPCRIRTGIFNPSYYITITEDIDRINEVRTQNESIRQQNKQDALYGQGKNQQAYKGLEPLRDIFEGINFNVGNRIQKPQVEVEDNIESLEPERPRPKEIPQFRPYKGNASI